MTSNDSNTAALPVVFVVGHGSRRAKANAECATLCERFAASTGRTVELGFIELAQPDLAAGLDAAAARSLEVTVFPLMLFSAGHVKQDVPDAVRAAQQRHPQVRFRIASPLGVDPRAIATARQRADAVLAPGEAVESETMVLFVGRGSSDPDANGDLYKTARLFGEGRRYALVQPAFMGATTPRVADGLAIAARLAPRHLLVVPYLLFAGLLVDQLEAEAAAFARVHLDIQVHVAGPLGPAEALADLMGLRIVAAERDPVPFVCEHCGRAVAGVSTVP